MFWTWGSWVFTSKLPNSNFDSSNLEISLNLLNFPPIQGFDWWFNVWKWFWGKRSDYKQEIDDWNWSTTLFRVQFIEITVQIAFVKFCIWILQNSAEFCNLQNSPRRVIFAWARLECEARFKIWQHRLGEGFSLGRETKIWTRLGELISPGRTFVFSTRLGEFLGAWAKIIKF